MSKRNKKSKVRESNSQLLERAERELEKGNAKAALKDAKVAFRNEPSPAGRKLLELAWVERVDQLGRLKLVSEARAALRELLEFKPTDPSVCQRLPRLQVLVGDPQADTAALFEQQPALLIEFADRALLDWNYVPPEHAGLPAQVQLVRDAFSAVEAGDDANATTLLNEIPRTSPLSEWKLFLRGLTAFYQRDHERTTANWQRLDPTRPPHRIAKTLRASAGEIPSAESSDVAANVKRLESLLGGDAYELVATMGELWRNGNWQSFLAALRRFRQLHAKTHEATWRQISELAWRRVVRESNRELFVRLKALLPAPELDPHWHRVDALFAERSAQYNATAVENAWKAYAGDLRELPALREAERPVAEGLVYLRLGRKFVEFAESNASRMRSPWGDEEEDDGSGLRETAAQFFRHSMQVCPQLSEAYREAAKLHEETEDLGEAAAIREKLLKYVPDDFDTQLWLARYYLERDEPDLAAVYTAAARRLKPRDSQCLVLGWLQQLTKIRCLTKNRKLDEARSELLQLHGIRPPEVEPFILDLIAAAIEFKAKNQEAAYGFVETAVSRLAEPTAVWLQMSAICARYSLSRDIKKVFDQRYKEAIEKPPTSHTAGLLAYGFQSFKCNQINYVGRVTQERLAIGYLHRTAQVQWGELDLATVCEWLFMLPRQADLLEDLALLGVELFPHSPRLAFVAGADEMRRGPYGANCRFALELFQAAIENNEGATFPLSPSQLQMARQSLSTLEEYLGTEGGNSMGSEYYDDDDDDDDDDYDFYDDGGAASPLPPGLSIRQIIGMMPPRMREFIEQSASERGITVEEMVAEGMGFTTNSRRDDQPPPQARRRRHAPQTNQTQFGFGDD